jgi:hypothetical protein
LVPALQLWLTAPAFRSLAVGAGEPLAVRFVKWLRQLAFEFIEQAHRQSGHGLKHFGMLAQVLVS